MPEDLQHPVVSDAVKKFVYGCNGCESIDCVLIRLSTAIYTLEDYASKSLGSVSPRSLIQLFLENRDVKTILAGLAPNIDAVVRKIYNDPRFDNIKRYAPQIIEAINRASAECTPQTIYADVEYPSIFLQLQPGRGSSWESTHAENRGRSVSFSREERTQPIGIETGARHKHTSILSNYLVLALASLVTGAVLSTTLSFIAGNTALGLSILLSSIIITIIILVIAFAKSSTEQ